MFLGLTSVNNTYITKTRSTDLQKTCKLYYIKDGSYD